MAKYYAIVTERITWEIPLQAETIEEALEEEYDFAHGKPVENEVENVEIITVTEEVNNATPTD